MKKIYKGILFVAFLLVAIYGIGGTEPTEVAFFPMFLVLVAIVALMYKAGMIEKPISKEEYYKRYK